MEARPESILIIEDDPDTRENVATILEMEGYHALTASNGQAGLDCAVVEEPALIVCDISMPEMDGYDVLSQLRQKPETAAIPFIFLTAHGERCDVRNGMNLGADDYLCKPVDTDDLLASIRARLQRSRRAAWDGFHPGPSPDFSSAEPLEELGLTPREAEALLWVAQGKSNADVATILGMSEKTVKLHLTHIFEKFGVETRTSAALVAVEKLWQRRNP